MIYTFTRRDRTAYNSALASDLSARKAAEATTDIDQVETIDGRNVWRRVTDIEPVKRTLTSVSTPEREARRRKYRPDLYERPVAIPGFNGDLSDWLDRKK